MKKTSLKTDKERVVFKNDYINQIIEKEYMHPVYEDLVKNYTFNEILDCGCGNGVFGKYFKKIKGIKLYGIDGSEYALNKARERGYDNLIRINDFSNDKLPYPDCCFDFVLCKDVFKHLVNPVNLLTEIVRVLREGGHLLLHVPNHFPWKSRIKFFFSLNIDTHGYFKDASEWDYPHLRFFTYKGVINKICKECNMRLVKNYSKHFATYFPGTFRIKPFRFIQEFLADNNPTLFSEGITLLFRK